MFDKLLKYGLGVSLVFGGAVGFRAADMLFQKIISVLLFFGAIAFCTVMLVQAAAEDRAARPIEDDVRRIKIKEKPWVRKYYNGEFDPEDDTSSVSSADSFPSRGSRGAEAPAVKIRKFVI